MQKIDAYECPTCGELYDDPFDASHCCDIETTIAYKCSCGKIFLRREKAVECENRHQPVVCASCGLPLTISNDGVMACTNASCGAFMRTAIAANVMQMPPEHPRNHRCVPVPVLFEVQHG